MSDETFENVMFENDVFENLMFGCAMVHINESRHV